MATRVHWACILVINCNILLIIYCYLYFCLHATDYAVYLHHSESNRGTQKVSLHEAMELYEDMSELVLSQAVCWHSPEMYNTRNSHLRATRKSRQAHGLCLRRIYSVKSCRIMVFLLSVKLMLFPDGEKITGSSVQVSLRNSFWAFLPVCDACKNIRYQISAKSLWLLNISLKLYLSTDWALMYFKESTEKKTQKSLCNSLHQEKRNFEFSMIICQ